MRFVVVTGMSGAGKRTAMKMLEDIGFYCVDNLPIRLIEKLVELEEMHNDIDKLALGLDVRAHLDFDEACETLRLIKEKGYNFEIIFMDASDMTLIKRYKETRRIHPLCTADTPRIEEGIRKEREILSYIREKADYLFDTSNLLTRDLKKEIDRIFIGNEDYKSLMVNIISFGFKYGIPYDADLVFDVRFLPNPFYIDSLKNKTGLDREVSDYVMGFEESGKFLDKLADMLEFLLPGYVNEGKHQLVIAIGCTGGKHRSVTLAGSLYDRLGGNSSYGFSVQHRDIRE